MSTERKRCAIYTRKSHEEGLEQEFNSLDAQRQAGEDYIRSQKHEGWTLVEGHYDDGGFSGGNTDRPALKQLMLDIERGEIDVVVVYKVDRLSRSLHDFAQLMKVFDERGVSFVSVTQQFNTTTSMGRLTLNMLLSFAQFEREVTGERIRDKLAASKRRGLWITGQPPLGYRAVEQRLQIHEPEAEIVREIFRGYLELNSRVELAKRLYEQGHTTKQWTSPSSGKTYGGRRINTTYIDKVLNNSVYIGRLTHKGEVFDGIHEPIIERSLWDEVQKTIETKRHAAHAAWTHPYLLKGKLKTDAGSTMSPSYVPRPASRYKKKRKVRYYVSQQAMKHGFATCDIKTVNSEVFDDLIRSMVICELEGRGITGITTLPDETRDLWLRKVIERVVVGTHALRIELNRDGIDECREQPWASEGSSLPSHRSYYTPDVDERGRHIVLSLAIRLKKIDGRRIILSPEGHDLILPSKPEPQQHIIDAIGRAYLIHEELLKSGKTAQKIADERNLNATILYKSLRLTQLSPRILHLALTGKLSPRIALRDLYDAGKIPSWRVQETMLGLDRTTPAETETAAPA